jgi:[ribosomal protein S5]-alanine N-acetyltransferase
MLETDRLTIRRITEDDAAFMLAMLNDPGFLANIGDRGVRTIGEAQEYIRGRILGSYAVHGFGMLRVALREDDRAVGMVGFVRRDGLAGPDLGFAFLAGHVGQGFGHEAARALLASAPDLRPLYAITSLANEWSAALLVKLGFVETGLVRIPAYPDDSRLFELC